MEKIKNLLVDMGGVLINLNRPRCIASFEEIGVSSIRELITTTYLQEGLFLKIEEGSITAEEFRDGIRKLTSQTLPTSRSKMRGLRCWLICLLPNWSCCLLFVKNTM